MSFKIKIFLIISFLVLSNFCNSQVTVAPVSVHLSDANKNGYFIVRNNSSTIPWEVGIDMKFGYPKSDSAGNTYIYFPDTVKSDDPSAVGWVSFFPRKFVLKPFEEQTVRISAKPKKDLPEGEYWGRPVIKSRAQTKIDTSLKEQINVGLSVEFHTVIALNYRRGNVNTGVEINNVNVLYDSNKAIILTELKRTGNCAFLGNIEVRILSKSLEILREEKSEISVYYDLNKRTELDTKGLQKGFYTVEIELNTDREESGGKILKINPITRKALIELK